MTPEQILNRSIDQRRREFKYRFGQSVVFGAPVIALQCFGHHLGGSPAEADRWVAVLQALLTGWIAYVCITGMLVEGLLHLRDRITADLAVSLMGLGIYLYSLTAVAGLFVAGRLFYRPLLFHWVVLLMAAWSGLRWWMLRDDSKSAARL